MAIQPDTGNNANSGSAGLGSAGAGMQGGWQGGTTTDTGASRGGEVVREAKEKTREVVNRASERARDGIDVQKSRAARELHTVADVLRSGCDNVRGREDSAVAPYMEKVADQVERLSNTLETRSVDEIVRDVEHFARRRPALFLGGCFVLGVAAARFLKSSEPSYARNLPAPLDNDRTGYGATGYPPGSTGYGTTGNTGYGATGNTGTGYSSDTGSTFGNTGRASEADSFGTTRDR